MRLLITGATGFIGSTAVARLNQTGVVPRVLVRSSSSFDLLKGLQYEAFEGSLQNEDSLIRACEGVEGILHLAGSVSGFSLKDFIEKNAIGTERLGLAASKASTVKRFVYVSSLAAGGPNLGDRPRKESDSDMPVSHYGESKREGEERLRPLFAKLPISIVRPPVVYGPRDAATLLLAKTATGLITPMPVSRGWFPSKRYSAIHAEDLVDACLALFRADAQARLPSGEKYYVTGGTIDFHQWMKAIEPRSRIIPIPQQLLYPLAAFGSFAGFIRKRPFILNLDKYKEIKPDSWICDDQKIRAVLGIKSKISFESGMRETVRWYREHLWLKS